MTENVPVKILIVDEREENLFTMVALKLNTFVRDMIQELLQLQGRYFLMNYPKL
jgi:hypothetical protein